MHHFKPMSDDDNSYYCSVENTTFFVMYNEIFEDGATLSTIDTLEYLKTKNDKQTIRTD
jgi:hypothetical protein